MTTRTDRTSISKTSLIKSTSLSRAGRIQNCGNTKSWSLAVEKQVEPVEQVQPDRKKLKTVRTGRSGPLGQSELVERVAGYVGSV